MTLTHDQIGEILPHRYPFLLVDKIIELEPGASARGIKCVSASEPWCQGHFPQTAIMPGVLILEALAQTGAVALLSVPENKGRLAVLGGVRNARFKGRVAPGDVLELECQLRRQVGSVGFAQAAAWVEGKPICTAELTFSLTDAGA